MSYRLETTMKLYKSLFLFAALLCLSEAKKKNKDKEGNSTEFVKWGDSKYDFVIIGCGTAGSVLARRLAENPEWKVLVLEAGQLPPTMSKIPVMAPTLQMTAANWKYKTEPQTTIFKGLNDQQMLWSSGKAYGGSSAINYMMYSRGNKDDFDHWGQGSPGWSYQDVLPYFLKSERANLEFLDRRYHNLSGLMSVEYSHAGDLSASFLKAAQELGFNMTDYNGDTQLGFSILQAFLKDGGRQTMPAAFLKPIQHEPNIEIVLLAQVLKLNIDAKNKKVKGVKFMHNGKKYRVKAAKEVILSAGTFNSPQLLMLSGIGPKNHLTTKAIEPVLDLPVGENLGDHVVYPGLNFINNSNRTQLNMLKDYILELPYWYLAGKGVLSSLSFEATGFAKLPSSPANQKAPDVEILFFNSLINNSFKRVMNLKDSVYDELYKDTENLIKWSIYTVLLHPKSKGKVLLRSKNPNDAPMLQPNYFAHKDDMATMIEGIKLALKFADTKEFKATNTRLNPNPVPGCKADTTEYWECAVRTLAMTSFDPFGTCKMGSVVDDKLKVLGAPNLRVVDASVIPVSISGHLAATTVMIAEKAADLIKKAHLNRKGA